MLPLTPFMGRQRELALLQQQWTAEQASLLILYGRRRVGKSRLIQHWIESSRPRVLYWMAEATSAPDQLRSFSQALYLFENGHEPPEAFTYASWSQVFQQVARLAREARFGLALDEFTYLLAITPGIASLIQKAWDLELSRANVFIILSGSHIGMMQRELLSHQAPLYGRATALLQLQPLPFAITRQYFPAYRPDARVAAYAILGGIPAYWERFRPRLSLNENIRQHLLSDSYLLQNEPRLLLQDFLSDVHNYVSILRAIANQRRTPKEIGTYTGLNDRHLTMYLSNLCATGFVDRRVPVTAGGSSRQGRYAITDPFLRFYFRFLSYRQNQLAQGQSEPALEEIKRHLLDFIGTHTWEELSREWLLAASARHRLPFLPDQVGSAWNREAQVDVVGINSMEKTCYLGECKWSPQAVDAAVLADLFAKASQFIPAQGEWRVYFLGFARGGWKPAARQLVRRFKDLVPVGSNWKAVGLRLLTLAEVDDDLAVWSA